MRYRKGGRAGGVISQIDVFEVREVAGTHIAEALGVEAARLAAFRVCEVGRAAGRGQRHGILVVHGGGHEGSRVFVLAGRVLKSNASRGTQITRGSLFCADGALGCQSRDIVGFGDDIEALVGM